MSDIYFIKLYGELSNDNTYAKISIQWLNQVDKYKWYLGQNNYPFTYIKGGRVPLHRYIHWLINGYWSDLYIDHINRDRLDSTDNNLREATAKQNSYNKTYKNENHNIRYKKKSNTYEVIISKDNKLHKIDNINSLEEAKNIYKLMAEELFGNFAPI